MEAFNMSHKMLLMVQCLIACPVFQPSRVHHQNTYPPILCCSTKTEYIYCIICAFQFRVSAVIVWFWIATGIEGKYMGWSQHEQLQCVSECHVCLCYTFHRSDNSNIWPQIPPESRSAPQCTQQPSLAHTWEKRVMWRKIWPKDGLKWPKIA